MADPYNAGVGGPMYRALIAITENRRTPSPVGITDTERLDWLEQQTNGDGWVARQSTTGRGFRLHNSSESNYVKTARAAIDAAIAATRKEG